MAKYNVLWIMSDQHNANCVGYRNHPNVKTPNLDRIAQRDIDYVNAFANNPICSPSRICFMTGQHVKTHGMFGNDHADYQERNPDTLACQFRKYGYQTALIGKSHMVRKWDEEGFEFIRYTDLADAKSGDPFTTHYFQYLYDKGLIDQYEEGVQKPGQEYCLDGSKPSVLEFEDSLEHFIGEQTLDFLQNRDADRPFFVKMSFQRPHEPIAPAKEFFDLYDEEDIVLPDSAVDYFENGFNGKPQFMQDALKNGSVYPLANPDKRKLKRCMASYFGLISQMDYEIGRVLDELEKSGDLENTVIFYTADHGDFAGEHGLFHKNFGIYDSIQRIPFLLSVPNGKQGVREDQFVESLDWYVTICSICNVPVPAGREGANILEQNDKDQVFCEWEWFGERIFAIRTKEFRLVFYSNLEEGELYDHRNDDGELHNLWNDTRYQQTKLELIQKLLKFSMGYQAKTDILSDGRLAEEKKYDAVKLVHKNGIYWSRLEETYREKLPWAIWKNK